MTAPISPPPASLLHAEAHRHDLDARIEQAEQRLIRREENLRRRAGQLGQRLRQAWQPGRLLWPLLALGAGLGWWGWRGWTTSRRAMPAADAAPLPAGAPGTDDGHGAPWVHLLALLWPLLPAAWRARMPAALPQLAAGVGLPLLDMLLRRRAPPPLAGAGPLELAWLAGDWHEVARLPGRHGTGATRGQPHWQHTLHAGGAIEMRSWRPGPQGDVPGPHAVATALPGSAGSRLRVREASAWPFGGTHELVVLHLDADALLLGSPGRERLRLLSRRPRLPPGRLQALLDLARDRGFATHRLQFVDDTR